MGRFKEIYQSSCAYLDEGVMDYVYTYQLIKRLGMPFNKWPAFTAGIIDDKGEILREPTSNDRTQYWGYFDRMAWNIKKIITKFTGHSQLTAALVTMYLLKEGLNNEKTDEVTEKLFGRDILVESSTISSREISANYNIIKRELI